MRLSFSTLCTERYGRVSLEKEEEGVLQSLCDRIQQQIKKFSDHGAFIKLSCRSPKDCGMVLDSFQPVLEEEMNKIMIEAKTYDLEVQSLFPLAFCRSTIRSLRVFSGFLSHFFLKQKFFKKTLSQFWSKMHFSRYLGDEVLSLLLESQRIFDDLLLYLDRVNKGQMKWDMELLIRKWEDIDPAAEVRVYVSSGEIRAIGQYHESYYVPQLVDQTFRKQYEEKIFQIVTHLQPRLSFQNYTIDFAPDQKDSSRIWVIEINPPPPLAGTPMFTFEEQELLQKGPYCFRFLELHPADETTACVPPKFLKWMKEFAKSKNEFQKKGEEEKRDQTVSVHSNQSSGSWCCIL